MANIIKNNLKIDYLVSHANTETYPMKLTENAAAFSLLLPHELSIDINRRILIDTTIKLMLPELILEENDKQVSNMILQAQISSDMDLAINNGFIVIGPSIIPYDYTGNIKILCMNLGDKNLTLKTGTPFATLAISMVPRIELRTNIKIQTRSMTS